MLRDQCIPNPGKGFLRQRLHPLFRFLILFPAFLISCNAIEPPVDPDGTFTDPRDSTEYAWVKIGSQTWMAENIRYNVKGSEGWWCYN